MGKLDGKVAVVTGAARGIGRADALLFAKEGAAVFVSDIDEGPLMEVVKDIKAVGGEADGCAGDVTKREDCQKIMDRAAERFGKIDILVNNAGLTRDALISRMTEAQWDTCVDISLKGTFNCIKAASKYMMKDGHNGDCLWFCGHALDQREGNAAGRGSRARCRHTEENTGYDSPASQADDTRGSR
jgi:3-oxoacyl-[acyl-carrier protein] reductase